MGSCYVPMPSYVSSIHALSLQSSQQGAAKLNWCCWALQACRRHPVKERWKHGDGAVIGGIMATSAFGMGIDCPNKKCPALIF